MVPTTHEQAAAWVAQAIEDRQELLDALGAGELGLADAFEKCDLDDRLGALNVVVVVESCRGRGKVATRRGLAALGIPEGTPVGSLSADQRKDVLNIAETITPRAAVS